MLSNAKPELPTARRNRFVSDYGLSTDDADVLTQRKDIADYFELGVRAGASAKHMAGWTQTENLRIIHDEHLDRALTIDTWPISAERPWVTSGSTKV